MQHRPGTNRTRDERVLSLRSRSASPDQPEHDRVRILSVFVMLMTGVIIARLFDLQVLQHPFYEALASDQHEVFKELRPVRGEVYVYDHRGNPDAAPERFPIATNQELTLVYGVPKRISDPKAVVERLATVLSLDQELMIERLSKPNDLYEPIEYGVAPELVEKIRELKIDGIQFAPEQSRYYTDGRVNGSLTGFLGFVDGKRVGQYGIEQAYETELSGKPGSLKAERSASGQIIGIGDRIVNEALDGADVQLTIERSAQNAACSELEKAVDKYDAKGGEVVVMDPNTGRILAMCSFPTFDPNAYGDVDDLSLYLNRTISHVYEPGSTFKPFVMATALDLGKVTPDSTYTDPGVEVIAGYPIRNYDDRTYGLQTMTGVLEKSINTGAIYAMRTVGPEKFYEYLQRFGFATPTGIELPGEESGNLGNLATGKDVFAATASFGQGINVTALQLTRGFAVIANGGRLVKPQIVDALMYPDGTTRTLEPEQGRQIITAKTSKTLSAMLASVVEHGHARYAAIPGYYVAGKTGTAQIASANGGYDPNKTNHTFTGFFPVSDPKILMTVHLEEPTAGRDAAVTAAPTWAEIAKLLAEYYRIPHDRDLTP